MPPAALRGDSDGAPKARKTGWRMDRAVVVEAPRLGKGNRKGPAERIAPQRRAKLATVPDADVARRGMWRGSSVGPVDRRAHLNAQRGRREREVLNRDRRDRAPRHPAARGHREPRAGGELAGSAEQNKRVQYRGAEHATPANSYPVRHWAAPAGWRVRTTKSPPPARWTRFANFHGCPPECPTGFGGSSRGCIPFPSVWSASRFRAVWRSA